MEPEGRTVKYLHSGSRAFNNKQLQKSVMNVSVQSEQPDWMNIFLPVWVAWSFHSSFLKKKNVRFPNSGMSKWLLFRGQPLFFFFHGENEILLVNGKYQQWNEAPEQSAKHVPQFKTKPPQAEEGGKNQWADQNVLSMSLYRGVLLTHDGLIDWVNVFFFCWAVSAHDIALSDIPLSSLLFCRKNKEIKTRKVESIFLSRLTRAECHRTAISTSDILNNIQ